MTKKQSWTCKYKEDINQEEEFVIRDLTWTKDPDQCVLGVGEVVCYSSSWWTGSLVTSYSEENESIMAFVLHVTA